MNRHGRGASLWYRLAGASVSLALLWLALRGVDWSALQATARQAHVGFLAVAGALIALTFFLRSLRWRVLVTVHQPVRWFPVFAAMIVGYLGNLLLPARAGEVIRSVALGRQTGLGAGYVFATALSERVLDAVVLLVIALISVVMMPDVTWLQQAILPVAVVLGAAVGTLLIGSHTDGWLSRLARRLPIPMRFSQRLSGLLGQFVLGLRALRQPKRVAQFAVYTALVWSVDATMAKVTATAFGLHVNWFEALLLLAVLGLASAVPSAPGYVGVYQFVAMAVLVPLGLTRSQALVYVTVLQALTYLVALLLGLPGMWHLNLSLASMGGLTSDLEAEQVP